MNIYLYVLSECALYYHRHGPPSRVSAVTILLFLRVVFCISGAYGPIGPEDHSHKPQRTRQQSVLVIQASGIPHGIPQDHAAAVDHTTPEIFQNRLLPIILFFVSEHGNDPAYHAAHDHNSDSPTGTTSCLFLTKAPVSLRFVR